MTQPKVGDTVRIVKQSAGVATPLYAIVLSIAPIFADFLGKNGEPTISVAYIDSPDALLLGKVNWWNEFDRTVGVPHQSHPSVQSGQVSTYWVDRLPDAGTAINLAGFNDPDTTQEALAEVKRAQRDGVGTGPVPALAAGNPTDALTIDWVKAKSLYQAKSAVASTAGGNVAAGVIQGTSAEGIAGTPAPTV